MTCPECKGEGAVDYGMAGSAGEALREACDTCGGTGQIVSAITKLVQPHGLVLWPRADSDHEGYDRARDELAVEDPYDPTWEPAYEHGPVTVASPSLATEASSPLTAGPNPAAAAEPSSARRPAGTPAQS